MLELLYAACSVDTSVTPAVDATTSDVEFCMKCKLHHSNPGNELVFCDSCMTCEFASVARFICTLYVQYMDRGFRTCYSLEQGTRMEEGLVLDCRKGVRVRT